MGENGFEQGAVAPSIGLKGKLCEAMWVPIVCDVLTDSNAHLEEKYGMCLASSNAAMVFVFL